MMKHVRPRTPALFAKAAICAILLATSIQTPLTFGAPLPGSGTPAPPPEESSARAGAGDEVYLPVAAVPAGPLPAFPGASGFGAASAGGRGGRVIEVTNLNDSGPGSLRAAVEASGPRIVVFRVGGTITLQSTLKINHPYITIAGQTAPGGGITLRAPGNQGFSLLAISNKRVHDVVVRYLRFRIGKSPAYDGNNVSIAYGTNVIFDHVSFQWSNDHHIGINPTPNGTPIQNVTIQRSILAAGLWPHSTAMLLKQYAGAPEIRGISIHHNLFAHNSHRNPRLRSSRQVEVVNNVIYNWSSKIGETVGDSELDLVNNYLKLGPWTQQLRWLHYPYDPGSGEPTTLLGAPSLYIAGNVAAPQALASQWDLVRVEPNGTLVPAPWRRTGRIAQGAIPIPVQRATDAYNAVLSGAGANARLSCKGQWILNRDAIDQAIIDHVKNGTGPSSGSQVDHQNDFGGYPVVARGVPCADADHDGMPDEWEQVHGFNPQSAADGPLDADRDGYTNVEEYLNGSRPRG